MTGQEIKELCFKLNAVSIFRDIMEREPLLNLKWLAEVETADVGTRLNLLGQFIFSLADYNYSFSDFLQDAIYTDENKYIVLKAKKGEIPESAEKNAENELKLFTSLTKLTADDLIEGYDGYIPQFENEYIDFVEGYKQRIEKISDVGYGIFAGSNMFRVQEGVIMPVTVSDDISPDRFVGYEAERKQVFDNTVALIEGKPAANILLYGDAGTGKSSTVKACANYFADKGVRLIEIRKDQLFSLSDIMAKISSNPLKFIIFIDDLSFNKNDDCFSMLKAALEGSASALANNAVIYATSNRRHIVKESFADRSTDQDDIHHNDTVQELLSLSDRFGLTVYFEKPNKKLYLDIVHAMAEKNGIEMDYSDMDILAERFALNKGSRSPRTAEHFVDSLM